VDESKRFYYREMIEMYTHGSTLTEIARWLSENIPRQRNNTMGKRKRWSVAVVKRILASEVHLGYVSFGKHKNKRGVRSVLPKEEWITSKGTHESLKSEEEHREIMDKIVPSKTANPKARVDMLPLSGVIYCDKCGARMIIKTNVYKSGTKSWSVICSNRNSHEDTECDQKSSVMNDDFFEGLYQRVVHIDENLQQQFKENDQELTKYKQFLSTKEKELSKHKQAVDRLYEMREENSMSRDVFLERKKMRDDQIESLKLEIEDLNLVIQELGNMPSMEKIKQSIKFFKENWLKIETVQERNKLLKYIVEKITYNRIDKNVYLGIHYN
jgi:site-specific DNA recombinase